MKLESRLTSPAPRSTSLDRDEVSAGVGDGVELVGRGIVGVERIAAGDGSALGRIAALANTPASPRTTAIARSAPSDRAAPPRLRYRPAMNTEGYPTTSLIRSRPS